MMRCMPVAHLHQDLEEPDPSQTEQHSLDVVSETLGLTGRVDAIRHRNGSWVPYEDKRGRCARTPAKEPAAWPSDRLQLLAYALLLEEAVGTPVREGRVRYHTSNVTVRVAVDEQARTDVAAAVARARALRANPARPPITDNERLCIRCSLAPVCLPEEERLARDTT
jgi:CRISP-associated protein Cas1